MKNAASETTLPAGARAARTGRRFPSASLVLLSLLVACGSQLRLHSGEYRGRLEQGAGPATETRIPVGDRTREGRGPARLDEPVDRMPGILAKVYVEEGQWLEKGQLLAELINDDSIARVDIATHELTQAEHLELLGLGSQ